MSVKNLAALLDTLAAGPAFVTEGETSVVVSGLDVAATHNVADLCETLVWSVTIEDTAGTHWNVTQLDDDFAPYVLTFDKPAAPAGALRLLTNTGFADWLGREDDRTEWQIACLGKAFSCYGVTFSPWSENPAQPALDDQHRNARALVREIAGQRSVPANMERWLLSDRDSFPEGNDTAAVWVEMAARKLVIALPDEFDAETRVLRFKGPPRLDLTLPASEQNLAYTLGRDGFRELQAALDWTFEVEREAEMRHILLAAELARSGGTSDTADNFIKENVADALASAKLAYQMQLAGMSSDALKTLSELRKTVSDDTAKVAEGTRQIIAAVAGSLAVGVGLIGARLAGSVNAELVVIVMALAATYVAITILSGVLFTLLQRQVRKAWQPRLYRFLTKADYKSLVGGPAKTAEVALWVCAGIGLIAIVLIVFALAKIEPKLARNENASASASSIASPTVPIVSESDTSIRRATDTTLTKDVVTARTAPVPTGTPR